MLLEPWITKGFTISALVRIYKIQELLVHALLIVVEKYKKLLKKHHHKNHPSDPPPLKVAKKFKCEGCDKEEPTQHLRSHGLQYYEESGLWKENPTLLFEKDLGWYDAHQLNVVTNRKGDKQTTSTRTSTTNISAAPTRRRTSTTR